MPGDVRVDYGLITAKDPLLFTLLGDGLEKEYPGNSTHNTYLCLKNIKYRARQNAGRLLTKAHQLSGRHPRKQQRIHGFS